MNLTAAQQAKAVKIAAELIRKYNMDRKVAVRTACEMVSGTKTLTAVMRARGFTR